ADVTWIWPAAKGRTPRSWPLHGRAGCWVASATDAGCALLAAAVASEGALPLETARQLGDESMPEVVENKRFRLASCSNRTELRRKITGRSRTGDTDVQRALSRRPRRAVHASASGGHADSDTQQRPRRVVHRARARARNRKAPRGNRTLELWDGRARRTVAGWGAIRRAHALVRTGVIAGCVRQRLRKSKARPASVRTRRRRPRGTCRRALPARMADFGHDCRVY